MISHEYDYSDVDVDEDTVLFQDKFIKFFNRLKAGELRADQNNIEYATNLYGEGWWEATKEFVAEKIIGSVADAGRAIGDWAKKQVDDVHRALSYRKTESEKQGGLMGGISHVANMISGGVRLKSWRGEEAEGVKYGTVRDLMIDKGIISLFASGQVENPTKWAIPIMDFLLKKFDMPWAPKVENQTSMHDLMWNFFNYADIPGYSWEEAQKNPAIVAGFAQSFLEYFCFEVLPEWNIAEQKLSDALSSGGIFGGDEYENNIMYAELPVLHGLFHANSIFKFMKEHLRFPLIETTVVDYDNASDYGAELLDQYRRDSGYYDRAGKADMAASWRKAVAEGPITPDVVSDAWIEDSIAKLKRVLTNAGEEAKYTGDKTWFYEMFGYYKIVMQEKNKRYQMMQEGAKIVTDANGVRKVVMPSEEEKKQLEEERLRKEREEQEKEEEERRKREEEEKKRLEEEAKRKEELVIAEAQMKAAQQIKEQEERYENVLAKMITDPGSITQEELNGVGEELNALKQEAENRIKNLPREEREVKLALIRGDKVSDKTFKELKDTAVGLQGSLQAYIEEVNKIPSTSILSIDNGQGDEGGPKIKLTDPDSVDMGGDD